MSIFWLFLTQEGHIFSANGVPSAINPAAHECRRLEMFCKLDNKDALAPSKFSVVVSEAVVSKLLTRLKSDTGTGLVIKDC